MFADQALDHLFRLLIERVVCRPHICEFRIAALRRNAARVQDRVFRWRHLKRTVRMPEPIANGEKPAAIVVGEGLIVLIEIGHIRERRRQSIFVRRAKTGADGLFQLPESAAESELLIVGGALVVKHQHRVLVHSGVNCADFTGGKRLYKIDAGDLCGKARSNLANFHYFPLLA